MATTNFSRISKFRMILENYHQLEIGQPVLNGHVFFKLQNKLSLVKIAAWATQENCKNGFPEITLNQVVTCLRLFKKWKNLCRKDTENFKKCCDLAVHNTIKQKKRSNPSKSSSTKSEITTTTCKCGAFTNNTIFPTITSKSDASTNTNTNIPPAKNYEAQISRLKKKIKNLEDKVEDLETQRKKAIAKRAKLRKAQKQKPVLVNDITSRKLHYTCKLHNIASKNIPPLVESLFKSFNVSGKVFSNVAVARMSAELGFISDFVTADAVLKAADATLIFDATTRDGDHINNVMLCTSDSSYVVSIEHIPGGKAQDYAKHIIKSIERLAEVHAIVSDESFENTKSCLISKIKACLTDRAAVNRATIFLLEIQWSKQLIELNCNVHPLESISRNVCQQLKSLEDVSDFELGFYGKECIAHAIIKNIDTLRYSNDKGIIKEFKNFLADTFSISVILRYRGNRINIIFRLAYIYYVNKDLFLSFFAAFSETNSLCKRLERAFRNETACLELKVLGILGKLFTGPWMTTFYTSLKEQQEITDGIFLVKSLLEKLMVVIKDPLKMLERTCDFFDHPLHFDEGMVKLMTPPSQKCDLFISMLKNSLQGIINVLQRQYTDTFAKVDSLRKAALTSTRLHTMEAESVIGEYSDKRRSSATLNTFTISNIIKAKRNKVCNIIHGNPDLCDTLIKLAIPQSRSELIKNTTHKKEVQTAVSERISNNKNKKVQQNETKKLELEVRKFEFNHPTLPSDLLREKFPGYSELRNILLGSVLGRNISHIWNVDHLDQEFPGTIVEFKNNLYTVLYFYEDVEEEESEINKYQMAADYLSNDLNFI